MDNRASSREDDIVLESVREFAALQTYRNIHAEQWEESASLIRPTSRRTFFYGDYVFPGMKLTDYQIDVNGALCNLRFAAILDSLLTPRNMLWHMLGSEASYLMRDRQTKLWYEEATRILFRLRYQPIGNFSAQNSNVFEELGAFGNGIMFIDQAVDYHGRLVDALRYKNIPLGQMFMRENHQGLIDGFCRWFRQTAGQAVKMFDPQNTGKVLNEQLYEAAKQGSQMPYDFLHRVIPNHEYEPGRIGNAGKQFASYYIGLNPQCYIGEGGYYTFPVAASRYMQTPGEIYGRGPAQFALPALKTLNAEKRDFLTQGHRAVAPVLLTEDEGLVGLALRPGAMNAGGWRDGKPTVGTLPIGNIQVSKDMMDAELASVEGFFLVDLFKVLLSDPKIFTATQVVEMMSQRGILIAPSIGRQQSEYLGPTVEREVDIAARLRLLPPMPPLLREARGEYNVTYTSPLARDMRAQEVAGFNRTLDQAIAVTNATQDPAPLDAFDFDVALPAIANINGVPESWMADPKDIAEKRQARAQALEKQQQIQAAPAQAALMKAQAAQQKAGGRLPPQQQIQAPLPAPGAGGPGGQG